MTLESHVITHLKNAFLLGCVLISLSACVPIPSVSTNEYVELYGKQRLLTLRDGNVTYLSKNCRVSSWDKPPQCPGHFFSALLTRPATWDQEKEATELFSRATPYTDNELPGRFELKTLHHPGTYEFQRPAHAIRNTTADFIGYFLGNGIIWAKRNSDNKVEYQMATLADEANKTYDLVFVARDGDDLWLFTDPHVDCIGRGCYSISDVLDISPMALPANLQGRYRLYHATIGGNDIFRPVLSENSNSRINTKTGGVSATDTEIEFNFQPIPQSTISFDPEIRCKLYSRSTGSTWFMLFPGPFPIGEGPGETKIHFKNCTKLNTAKNGGAR